MPQRLLELSQSTQGMWVLGTLLGLLGVTFWLGGARFNRAVSTLTGVLAGSFIGMQLPGWIGWSVSGMGPAVAGAVLLGVAGFLLHKTWIAAGLGLIFAAGALCVTLHLCGPKMTWTIPATAAEAARRLIDLWHSLPGWPVYALPAVVGAALFAGVSIGILWPRLAMALTYSLIGVSMLAGLFVLSGDGAITRPHWLAGHFASQIGVFAAMVLLGVALQWRQIRRPAAAPSSLQDEWEEDEDS